MKIESNTTNKDLPWRFGLYQKPSSEENATNSSRFLPHVRQILPRHITEPKEELVPFSSDVGLW